jgi:hypothetical protein
MKQRVSAFGGLFAIVALVVTALIYSIHPVRGSDHQDTFNLANRSNTSADITDVFVFPAPDNPNNVVFAMDVSPLIGAGMGTTKFFDPTLMWQFKISHQASGVEDQVIQLGVNGTGASQTITLYGPAAPNEVGVKNTFLASPIGSATYNAPTTLKNGIQLFAGPRADPFQFDLFAFFTFLGDRNFGTHTSQSDPGQGDALFNGDNQGIPAAAAPVFDKTANAATPSFNGFPAGTMSGANSPLGNYACSTNPAEDTLTDIGGGFNVLTFVVEVPKSLLFGGTSGFTSSKIHVWATVNSSTGT